MIGRNLITLAMVAVAMLSQAAAGEIRPIFLYVKTYVSDDLCVDIKKMINGGVTHVLLGFYLHDGLSDASLKWKMYGVEKQKACMDFAHAHGAKIMLSAAGDDEHPYHLYPKAYGEAAAKAAMDLQLDGLDFDLEFLLKRFESTKEYFWVIESSKAARAAFRDAGKDDAVITHAPQAPYLGLWAGEKKGYVEIMKILKNDVDHYFVQYYNQQLCSYEDYETMFIKPSFPCWAPDTAWQQIKESLGADAALINKLVIGKPVTEDDVPDNTGYIEPKELHEILCKAEETLGYRAGIMGSSWHGENATKPWMDAVRGNC